MSAKPVIAIHEDGGLEMYISPTLECVDLVIEEWAAQRRALAPAALELEVLRRRLAAGDRDSASLRSEAEALVSVRLRARLAARQEAQR
jgi:hypothetical protein